MCENFVEHWNMYPTNGDTRSYFYIARPPPLPLLLLRCEKKILVKTVIMTS
jgi:hypothetical protein